MKPIYYLTKPENGITKLIFYKKLREDYSFIGLIFHPRYQHYIRFSDKNESLILARPSSIYTMKHFRYKLIGKVFGGF